METLQEMCKTWMPVQNRDTHFATQMSIASAQGLCYTLVYW